MTDRPIIFSGPMVQALIDGRKTQTRRLATSPLRRCEPGDRLWVRENFRNSPDATSWIPDEKPCRGWLDYQAGGSLEMNAPDFDAVLKIVGKDVDWDFPPHRWRPSIHMPRWASRLTLAVEAVRVEPLQEISGADAIAEGVTNEMIYRCVHEFDGPLPDRPSVGGYAWLWSCLHGRGSWDSNPDVLVLSFKVEQ